jgi:hypothetical protein
VWTDSAGVNTVNPSALPAGNYKVVSTDGAGCISVNYFRITEPNDMFLDSLNGKNPTCSKFGDGSLTVDAGGGNGGFTFTWSTTPAQQGKTVNNLDPGCYTVSVVDVKGCSVAIRIAYLHLFRISILLLRLLLLSVLVIQQAP